MLLRSACQKALANPALKIQFNKSKTLYMDILVFKTNVRNRKRVNALAPHLENMKGIIKWNIDLQDVDKVLRIECYSISANVIEKSLRQAGYFCEELSD
jgi:3'-phosphoadenosine 5'-phosphosulfate sulfotransferase